MVVNIKDDIFQSSDYKGLNFLIQLLTYESRYDLFVEITYIDRITLYTKLDSDDIELIEQNYNRIIQQGLESDYVVTLTNSDDKHFNIEEAIRFFIQPVSIILENSLNDQHFIRSVFKFFDNGKKIEKYLEKNWIQFENAGGCSNVENFIEGKLQSFNTCLTPSKFVRAIVILDSDKKFPTDTTPDKYLKLIKYLEANDVKYHILEKRTMQNYMPDEVLNSISSTNVV